MMVGFHFRQVLLFLFHIYLCKCVLIIMTGIPVEGLDDRPIPKTMNRIIADFTPDERRILYDFAVSKTRAAPVVKVEELNVS